MTTLEYLQLEAAVRGLTLEELMEQFRGTEGDIGDLVEAADVEWVRTFAEMCMRVRAATEIQH